MLPDAWPIVLRFEFSDSWYREILQVRTYREQHLKDDLAFPKTTALFVVVLAQRQLIRTLGRTFSDSPI
jgi:hypothetical protein